MDERDIPQWNVKRFGEETPQCFVSLASDRWRRDANFERFTMHAGDLGFSCAWLGMNLERHRTVGADAPPRS